MRVELVAATATFVAALCAALIALRHAVGDDAVESGRVIGARRNRLVQVGLVGLQITVVIALIAGALIFGRTLYRQDRAPLGLNPEGVLAVQLRLPARLYQSVSERSRTVAAMLNGIRAMPPDPIVYLSYAQYNAEVAPVALLVRTIGDPMLVGPAVRRAIVAHNPLQPIYGVQTINAFVAQVLAPQRFRTWSLALITALGLILAAVGIHGIVSRKVAERFAEIGIRKALGASTWQASAVGARDVGTAVGVGVTLSLPGTLFLSHLIAVTLPTAARLDAATFLAAVSVTLAVTGLAIVAPLRRAMSLEPLRALRTA